MSYARQSTMSNGFGHHILILRVKTNKPETTLTQVFLTNTVVPNSAVAPDVIMFTIYFLTLVENTCYNPSILNFTNFINPRFIKNDLRNKVSL